METKDYCEKVAKTIWQQIMGTTNVNVVFSWGISKVNATEYKGMAALAMQVQGLLHTGLIMVAYNRGYDTYEVYAIKDGEVVNEHTDVYFTELGSVLDGMIERKPEWSDDEYGDKIAKEMTTIKTL